MSKVAISEKGVELEFNKDDQEFVSQISKHNFFGMIGDHIAVWRWQNAAKIIEKSRKFAEAHSISLNKIPSKFLVEFMDNASMEEESTLQDIWARILANESGEPDTYSLRTLNALKFMSKSDAQNFSNLTKYLISHANEIFIPNDEELLKKYNINFDNLIKLEELGLILLQPMLALQVSITAGKQAVFYTKDRVLIVKCKPETPKKVLSIQAYTLTTVGKQLFSVIEEGVANSFIKDAGLLLEKQNSDIEITLHTINSRDNKKGINYKKVDILNS